MTPSEFILNESISPHLRYIRKYCVYTVTYGAYTVEGNPMYGLGQPSIYAVYLKFWPDLDFLLPDLA